MAYKVEEAIREWLDGAGGFDAYCFVPAERPSRFQTIERTGGGMKNSLDHPTVALQFWAETPEQAQEDALRVRDLVHAEGSRPEGCHLSVNAGPYPFDDPDSRQARSQLVLDCVTHI